jgi:2-polyprenyl-6-methoxyphenol hydroxylase-like FAD-dependent oxidoreductase
MQKPLKVMIVGAGAGGLCLAQGLKSDKVAVEVFDRDYSPTDRLQGYRLSINTTGTNALKACLPVALFERLVGSSANPSLGVTFLDHQLGRLLSINRPRSADTGVANELPVSRIALRRILLEGLDSVVHFGKKLVGFDNSADNCVTARFEDGSTATGDVLIGADGASSHVRAQLLPNAKRVETGIVAVTGKFGLSDDARAATPDAIFRGPTLILGPRGCFLFGSAIEYGEPTDKQRSPDDSEGYVMWGFSARRERFALPGNFETLNGGALKAAVLAQMNDWHPALQRMVNSAEVATVTAFPVKTSVPIPPWRTGRVTLLGDALHNMTPFRGIGANTALRDAAALHRALVAVSRGEADLIPSLALYEREMIDYGFQAVRTSLKEMERLHAESLLARTFTKTFFRVADKVPPFKAAIHGNG